MALNSENGNVGVVLLGSDVSMKKGDIVKREQAGAVDNQTRSTDEHGGDQSGPIGTSITHYLQI
jgi:hypothetical protein